MSHKMLLMAIFPVISFITNAAKTVEVSWSICADCTNGKYANVSDVVFSPSPPVIAQNVRNSTVLTHTLHSYLSVDLIISQFISLALREWESFMKISKNRRMN